MPSEFKAYSHVNLLNIPTFSRMVADTSAVHSYVATWRAVIFILSTSGGLLAWSSFLSKRKQKQQERSSAANS